MATYELLELHEYPELMEACCQLLNEQWKRSPAARLRSLEKSSRFLPASLLLVEKHSSSDVNITVIGHSRICQVALEQWACFIESVVVKKDRRGQGLGRLLMQKTEEYAKSLGFRTAFLTTHDKQSFYEHLGYTYCDAVEVVRDSWSTAIIAKLYQNKQAESARWNKTSTALSSIKSEQNKAKNLTGVSDSVQVLPPPPPPPLPPDAPPPPINTPNSPTGFGVTWMMKKLS